MAFTTDRSGLLHWGADRRVDHFMVDNARRIGAGRDERTIADPFHPADAFEARQFGKRIGMIVHPNVQRRPFVLVEDQDGRGLLSAPVSTSRFAGLHRQNKPLSQRQMGLFQVGRGGSFQDLRTGEHVTRERNAVAQPMPRPCEAGRARMRGRSAVTVDDVNLPVVPAGILPQQGAESLLRRCTCANELKAINAVVWIDERLVAMAPTSGAMKGTRAPAAKNLVATAMPSSPVLLSSAINDHVMRHYDARRARKPAESRASCSLRRPVLSQFPLPAERRSPRPRQSCAVYLRTGTTRRALRT